MCLTQQVVQNVLNQLPSIYRGPGGAVAVLEDGKLLSQHVWGYADIDQRIPMTPETPMPICSITKQMVCMCLRTLERQLLPKLGSEAQVQSDLESHFREVWPGDIGSSSDRPTLRQLCDNQSGLRDYWALTTLWGARPEGLFPLPEAGEKMLERLGAPHFPPGWQYAYANTNFHILARVIERFASSYSREDKSLAELLNEHVFTPAKMTSARLHSDNASLPGPCVGYEGDEARGFIAAVNRIQWSGDAGVVASLTDMIAYEKFLHHSWADETSIYRDMARPPKFVDGVPAAYSYGLEHVVVAGVPTVGHSGAVRGFRLNRSHVPSRKLSVVVMFNHEADAEDAAQHILARLLNGEEEPQPAPCSVELASQDWAGYYWDQEACLAIEVKARLDTGGVVITYAGEPDVLVPVRPDRAESRTTTATLDGDHLHLDWPQANRHVTARRLVSCPTRLAGKALVGKYVCDALDSTFHCVESGGLLYGYFDGFLGQGPVHFMRYLGECQHGTVWALTCPRGMDAPAPGDWTLCFEHTEDKSIPKVIVSCWLARKAVFSRCS
ncbi:beta-lactamase/transpeptidase-like protein [Aspergillus homomorphus CBS 101889]|uniref:Beta-lactamase/transpeptidase-like protein n=1 Tax=Aspergillus homomorphus (strain CBS 101889) TaxID=1450537 RepID=A0A395ID78_ASPHC|nr:beta-lactamase/transpeptidase-like protein [Aspergillus homomorphus CBS 101889]RAL17729.1 beta-lactamase/transpeptidase-like protein [Aspergillus homomorphus CBS 101889]